MQPNARLLASLCLLACSWAPVPALAHAPLRQAVSIVAAMAAGAAESERDPGVQNRAADNYDPSLPRRADGADIFADVPPPSAYDRLGKDGMPALAPESLGLLAQLGRTLMALAAVLALLYLAFKLLMPQVMKRLGPQRLQNLQVVERLMLDGKNSLVTVEHRDGRTFLLGVGEGGVRLLVCEATPSGGPSPKPVATATDSLHPRPENFAEALGQPAERPPATAL